MKKSQSLVLLLSRFLWKKKKKKKSSLETNDRLKIIHTPTCTQIHFGFLDLFTSYLREMYVCIYIKGRPESRRLHVKGEGYLEALV